MLQGKMGKASLLRRFIGLLVLWQGVETRSTQNADDNLKAGGQLEFCVFPTLLAISARYIFILSRITNTTYDARTRPLGSSDTLESSAPMPSEVNRRIHPVFRGGCSSSRSSPIGLMRLRDELFYALNNV